ncbi:MAG: methionine--tRNA ligase subunit beta, partial [Clostridia bacterium]|nr:methionine--tRNA ligase subunit beta [Clostridia bacterium]
VFDVADGFKVTSAPTSLFARLDMKVLEPEIDKIIEEQKKAAEKEAAADAGNAPAKKEAPMPEVKEEKAVEEEKSETITIDDFAKVQLKVGTIIACEKVEKSAKLLHETVRFGNETRSICSGIAKYYKPEELVGKKVVFVTNLPPRKMCGLVSEGMILGAEDENGNFALVCPEKDVADGTIVG